MSAASGPFEAEYVLILSGDQLYQMDFMDMLNNHIQQKARDIHRHHPGGGQGSF